MLFLQIVQKQVLPEKIFLANRCHFFVVFTFQPIKSSSFMHMALIETCFQCEYFVKSVNIHQLYM